MKKIHLRLQKSGIILATALPETNMAPKSGWLEYDPFLLGRGKAYFQRLFDEF